MKRPRWLRGGEPEAEGGDGETGAEPAREKREDESRPSSAADRSARRTARKSLSERVAADAPDREDKPSKPKSSSAGPVAGQPHGGAGRPSAGRPVRRHPRPDASDRGKATAGSKASEDEPQSKVAKPEAKKAKVRSKASKAKDEKELHRPKRQEGDEGKRKPPGRRGSKPAATKPSRDAGGDARRRKRKPLRPRVRGAASGGAKALRHGASETRKQVAASAPKVGRRLLAALAAIFAVLLTITGFAAGLLLRGWLLVSRPIRWVLVRLRRFTDAASRVLTPVRVLALVTAGAAILLALSQYADYRSISIGNDAYSGVQSIAPAPETARLQTGDAHSYVFVPVAIVCLLLLAGALTGRWRICRLIAIAGAAAIVIAIVVDRPEGLDPGDAAIAFEGVEAKLIGGFYAQIAAGILLIGSSTLLARELRLAGAGERSPARSRDRARNRTLRTSPPDTGSVGA